MHELSTYHIEVRGQIDESDLNARSPRRATLVRTDPGSTHFAICADQSGLIGMIRHLHDRGYGPVLSRYHADGHGSPVGYCIGVFFTASCQYCQH